MDEPRVVCVISAYRPDPALAAKVATLADQVAEVVVVDDGSGSDAAEVLLEIAAEGGVVVCMVDNSGIAAAINEGIAVSSAREGDYILVLDQDSVVAPGFVTALVSEHRLASADGIDVGSVSPESFAGISQASGSLPGGHRSAARPIQSGTLYPMRVLQRVGPFDETLFIDLVDTEFAMRLEAAGLAPIVAPGLDLPHRLGSVRQMRVLGRSVTVGLSAPFRYYYRARNRVIVTARYFRRWPGRMAREALRDAVQLTWSVAFAKQPLRMTRVLIDGTLDGVRRRGGRIPPRVTSRVERIQWRGREVS